LNSEEIRLSQHSLRWIQHPMEMYCRDEEELQIRENQRLMRGLQLAKGSECSQRNLRTKVRQRLRHIGWRVASRTSTLEKTISSCFSKNTY